MRRLSLLGIHLRDYSVRESMRRVNLYLNNGICNTIDFITHDVLLKAAGSEELRKAIEAMDMTVCTSADILREGNINSRNRDSETGRNLFLKGMLRKFSKEQRSLFLVAESESSMQFLIDSLNRIYGGLNVAATYIYDPREEHEDNLINEINGVAPDVVAVYLQSPYAEQLISSGRVKMNTKLLLALREVSLKVTDKGHIRQGKLTSFLTRKLFHTAAVRYEVEASQEEDTRENDKGKTGRGDGR